MIGTQSNDSDRRERRKEKIMKKEKEEDKRTILYTPASLNGLVSD